MALTNPQMQAVRDAVDAKLVTLWSAIQSREATFFGSNQRYWQGLRTSSALPVDGAAAVVDIGSTAPSYQGQPWPAALLSQIDKFALEITQYVAPTGPGYVGTISVVLNGNLWQRAQDSGQEPYRTFGWTNQGAAT